MCNEQPPQKALKRFIAPFSLFLSFFLLLTLPLCSMAQSSDQKSLSSAHKNLTVFLLKTGENIDKSYVTLEEAMEKKYIVLHETSDVNQLRVDNVSDKTIFIMAGDIVKGGKQDRTIGEDRVLRPKDMKILLAAYCVEQGRWKQRGKEGVASFSESKKMLSNKELKLAARESKSQGAVWENVTKYQAQASEKVKADVRSPSSNSSLPLALENDTLKATAEEYLKTLQPLFDANGDAQGMAFFVNGKLSTVDSFGNAKLFGKLQKKLLEAAVNEAISLFDEKLTFDPPTRQTLEQFIAYANKDGKALEETTRKTGHTTTEYKRKTDKSVLFRAFDDAASAKIPLHMSIYATEGVEAAAQHESSQSPFRYDGINRRMPQR